MNRPTPYLALALLALAAPILLAPAFPKPRSQGGTGSPNTWGEEMRTFFSPYYDLDTGSVVKTSLPSSTLAAAPTCNSTTANSLRNITDGIRGVWKCTGTAWVSVTGYADVRDFATGGAGTSGSPWTGWITDMSALPTNTHVKISGYASTATTLVVKNGWTLSGHGKSNSRIVYTGTGDAVQINNTINGSTAAHVVIEQLTVESTNGSPGTVAGNIVDQSGSFVAIRDVQVIGNRYGIIYDQTEVSSIDRVVFESQSKAGLWLVNGSDHAATASPYFTNRIVVRDSQFNLTGAGTYHIIDDGGAAHLFEGNNFNGAVSAARFAAVTDLTFTNNEVEGATGTMILFERTTERLGTAVSAGTVATFKDNTANPASAQSFINIASGSTLNTLILLGNNIGTSSAAAIVGGSGLGNAVAIGNYHAGATMFATQGVLHFEQGALDPTTIKGETILKRTSAGGTTVDISQGSATGYPLSVTPGADTTYAAITVTSADRATNSWRVFGDGSTLQSGPVGLGSYTIATLPSAGTAGRLARVTDGARGIWMDNGTEWIKINPNIDPKDFGVRGDGTTDDTANLLLAWGAAQTTGRELHLGPGTFRVCDDGVTAQTYGIFYTSSYVVKMRGAGKESTFLSNCGTLGAMVRLNGGYSELSDLTIDQNGSTGKALQVFSQHSKVRDVLIRDQGGASVFAWTVDGSTLSDFENVIISTSTNGLDIGPTTATNYNNYRNITIESCDGDYGLRINTGSGIKFYGIHFEDHGTCTDSNPIYIVASNDIELNGLTAEWKTGTTLTANGYIMVDNVNTLSLRDCYLDHASSASESLLYVSHASTRNISVDSCYVRSTRTGMTFATTANGFIGLHLDKITTIWTSAATGVNNTGAITDETIAGWTDSSGASSHTIDAVNFFGTNIAGNIAITSRADQSCFGCTGTISGTGAAALSRIGSTASISTLSVPGSLNIGAGASILNVLSASATLDFDLSAATTHDLTVTVTGSASGDVCSVGVPNGSITADTLFWCWVSASNTATVRAMRTAGTPNPASGTFRVMVTRF